MHKLHELKDKLIEELEAYSENGKYSKEDVEVIKYMASAVDHICNIMDGDEEYSNAMYPMNRTYSRRNSYSRARRRDSMGRYSRGYSMAGKEYIAELREIMQDCDDDYARKEIHALITDLEGRK